VHISHDNIVKLFVIACRDSEHGAGIVDMYLLLTSAT